MTMVTKMMMKVDVDYCMEDRCGNCPRLAPTDRDSDTLELPTMQ